MKLERHCSITFSKQAPAEDAGACAFSEGKEGKLILARFSLSLFIQYFLFFAALFL
jgi:hypothetical protein